MSWTQRLAPCRKLPEGSSLDHAGFSTIWLSTTLIIFSKNLLRIERTRAWYCHDLIDSSARHKFVSSDKFFWSSKYRHLQFLGIWRKWQWYFSNLLCANCSSKINSDPQRYPLLVHPPSEKKSHPLMASVHTPTTIRLGGKATQKSSLCKV